MHVAFRESYWLLKLVLISFLKLTPVLILDSFFSFKWTLFLEQFECHHQVNHKILDSSHISPYPTHTEALPL